MEGRVLNDRYRLEQKIGEGGMAIVFRAEDQLLGRKVAAKVLRPQFASDIDFIRRFQREARAAASLNHPHIVNVYDIGQDGDYHYLIMENVDGINLKQKLKNQGRISADEALKIASQITQALACAHLNDIVHCDIKPHNILLTEDKGCKVTDFGIARAVSAATLTHTDSVVGSAPYISPEQARGERLTSASDIYSLGVVLYEMMTGRLPFEADGPITLALKHIREKPLPPSKLLGDIPPYIERIIMKALEKDSNERYPDAESILRAIKNAQQALQREKEEKDFRVEDAETQELPRIKDYKTYGSDYKPRSRIGGREEKEKKKKKEREPTKKRKTSQFRTSSRSRKKTKTRPIIPGLSSKIYHYRFFIYSALLLFFVLGTALGLYSWYMSVPVVEVPDLIGLSEEEVEERLKDYQLDFVISGDQPHSEIPVGSVVSHFPQAGTNIRATRDVRLVLSSGPMWTEVPDLSRSSLREAEIIIGAAGLEIGEKEYEFSEDFEANIIIGQKPEAGEEIVADEKIDLRISQGSEDFTVRMPGLTGLTRAQAEDHLAELGLSLGEIEIEKSRRFREGQIIEHSPDTGTPLIEGSQVDLVMSSGLINEDDASVYSPAIRVPVPRGDPEQEIRIEIEDNNGHYILYEETHSPGDRVFQRVNTVGPTTVQVYINGNLEKEEKIGD